MATDITHAGTFIDATAAKANLAAYFSDEGKPQPKHDHPDHVFGHVFGLAKIKELMARIDQHNLHEPDSSKHINGLRIYHSKTHGKKDILVVPVTRDGHDYPEPVHHSSSDKSKGAHPKAKSALGPALILSDGRPCPNLCN